jgi:hypothetical protein
VGLRVTALWVRELLCWTRTSLVRGVFATADVARIAVTANAVIRVLMTILLGKISRRSGKHVLGRPDCVLYAPFVPLCVKYFTEGATGPSIFSAEMSAGDGEYENRINDSNGRAGVGFAGSAGIF